MLNLSIKPKDTAEIVVKHPGSGEYLATIIVAGPSHEVTVARRRDLDTARLDPSYKPDFQAEIQKTLCIRTLGWRDVKDENGNAVEFQSDLVPDLYQQEWLFGQVLSGLEGNSVFFKP